MENALENPGSVFGDEGKQLPRRGDGFLGDRRYPVEEVVDPPFPVTLRANGAQAG